MHTQATSDKQGGRSKEKGAGERVREEGEEGHMAVTCPHNSLPHSTLHNPITSKMSNVYTGG